MISRMLLVGMVGVLGISVPEGADWGVGLTWLQSCATAGSRSTREIAFEPITVVENPDNRIVEELNRRCEGLDIPVAPVAIVATLQNRLAPTRSYFSTAMTLMADFGRRATEAAARMPSSPRSVPHAVVSEADREIAKLFAENEVWSVPTSDGITTRIPMPRQPRPSFEPIPVIVTSPDLADVLNRASEGIDAAPLLLESTTRPHRAFEPIAVADAPGLADDLNRRSEGLCVTPEPEEGIGNAIRLTRSAAVAWMNVLLNTARDSDASN